MGDEKGRRGFEQSGGGKGERKAGLRLGDRFAIEMENWRWCSITRTPLVGL
ncbi:hypothetical protein TIFTF001_052678 [Ficus carica]|uniref:Uncharacterized protein n=1 Tax=Ficus carica TaxID=3494 RepID=A0AA88EB08_FICCA|nr:hypothetical protein TIFTF001_052677 [Ficus carica]GMN71447.1 hypothetical protein TIFTF001_052678 [Ficus carica]